MSRETAIKRTEIVVIAMSLCATVAAGLIAYSAYHWLRYGSWLTIALRDVLSTPHMGWITLQIATDRVWATPMWMMLSAAAFGLVLYVDQRRI